MTIEEITHLITNIESSEKTPEWRERRRRVSSLPPIAH